MKKQLFAISALMVTLGLTACGKPAETPKAADAGATQATAAAGGLIGDSRSDQRTLEKCG